MEWTLYASVVPDLSMVFLAYAPLLFNLYICSSSVFVILYFTQRAQYRPLEKRNPIIKCIAHNLMQSVTRRLFSENKSNYTHSDL